MKHGSLPIAVEPLERRTLLSLSPADGEFLVNTATTFSLQFMPSVAMDGSGDFVIAWASDLPGGGSFDVIAQRYDAAGATQGAAFRVNSYTTGLQMSPSVAMDIDGDFVIAWQSELQDGSSYGVYAQRYDAAGVAQGPELSVNTYTTDFQGGAVVAMDAAGNFVIAWTSVGQDGSLGGVYARRYNHAGIAQGGEFRVNTITTEGQNVPSVAMDASGDFVVAWQTGSVDGSSYGIAAQRYNAAGAAQGSEFLVNTYVTSVQIFPAVAMDSTGDFVVAWQSYFQEGPYSGYGIYAKRFNAAGVVQGGEFQVNTHTTNSQSWARVAMDVDGDFVVTWTSYGQDGNSYGVHAQSYSAAGVAQGSEFRVNTYTTGSQAFAAVAMSPQGDFAVAWTSDGQDGNDFGVYAQRYHESVDSAAPMIGGVFVNGRRTLPYSVQPASVTQVVVSFSEDVSTAGGSSGPNSVTNPANWRVARNLAGIVTDLTLSSIDYLFNDTTNRFDATLNLSGSFSNGDLQIVALDIIRDLAGNALDGDLDGASGGSRSLTFGIGPLAAHGPEFRVNTFTTDIQRASSVAVDADGDFVVVWQSYLQDGDQYGIYAQRYNAAGVAQGGEFRVNNFTTGAQNSPRVAMDAAGGFVVAWQGEGQGDSSGIYARRFNAEGVAQDTEFRVNGYTTNGQSFPCVAMGAAGDFVVAWQSLGQDGSDLGIFAQRYNAAGVAQGTEFMVNSYTLNRQHEAAVAMDTAGDFVVTWGSYDQDGDSSGIYARRYNAAGMAQGTEFLVNSYTTGHQGLAAVAMDAAGNFVVTWQSDGQDGSSGGIYAQRYNTAGVAQGTEFLVNSYTTSHQSFAAVAMDAAGDFVVAWQSYTQDGNAHGIYAQRYSSAGVAQGTEFRVNSYITGFQLEPSVAMGAAGEFVVAWESEFQDGDGWSIYAQRYNFGATPLVAALADGPDPVMFPSSFTLTATGVTDDGTVSSVRFYRESNGIAGLQFGSGGDTSLGVDINGGDGWTRMVSSSGLAIGTVYTYYAQAADNSGLVGAPASTVNTVVLPPGPQVLVAEFHYNTAPQKLKFTLDRNVSGPNPENISAADIHLTKFGGGSVPALAMLTYGTDGTNVASFTMDTQLADGNYSATIFASDVQDGGNPMAADYVFNFFILGGDANHDRRVDVADLVIFASNYLGTGKTYSQADFNYDGVVNKVDLGPMAQNWHQTLAAPAAALPAAPVSARPATRTPTRTPTRVIELVQ